jgi:hypothetical protein
MAQNRNLVIAVGLAGILVGSAFAVAHYRAGAALALASGFGMVLVLTKWQGPDA